MFDLSDAMTDDILFAMENQEYDFMIEAETGAIITMSDDAMDAGFGSLETGTDLIEPPEWTSQDGFALMDSFSAGVGDPIARAALSAALSRGRGVFKAFKKTMEAWPEIERRWFEYKRKSMVKRVAEWYDEARVARGLERLGPEPEEDEDLLEDDFLEEALSYFPEALVEYEYTAMEREISEGGREGLVIAFAEAVGGAIAGIAVARKVFVADSSFGKLVYLFVAPEHRRLGLGRRLAEATRTWLAKDDTTRFVVDMAFVPSGFGLSMLAYGYEAFGTRYLKSED